MKGLLVFTALFIGGLQAQAATLDCQAADGSQVITQIDAQGNLSQVSAKVGQDDMKAQPGANGFAILGQKVKQVGHFQFAGGKKYVSYASISDANGNLLAIVNAGKADTSASLSNVKGTSPAFCLIK